MKILLTGGVVFIGSNILERLISDDDIKPVDINKTKVLYYKNRWQERKPNPSKNRMDIIKKFL